MEKFHNPRLNLPSRWRFPSPIRSLGEPPISWTPRLRARGNLLHENRPLWFGHSTLDSATSLTLFPQNGSAPHCCQNRKWRTLLISNATLQVSWQVTSPSKFSQQVFLSTKQSDSANSITMSTKHLFPTTDGLVNKYLNGLIFWSPSLALIPSHRVVFNTKHDPSKVAIISEGGAGHNQHDADM